MLLSELISELGIPCVFSDTGEDLQNRWVDSAAVLDRRHGAISPSALYITADADLAAKVAPAVVLLVGAANRAADIYSPSESSPEKLALRAKSILEEYGRFLSIQRQLLSLMERRRPLKMIYEAVYQATGFPLSAGTSNGMVIYITEESQSGENGPTAFHLPNRSANADWFTELSQARIFEKSEHEHEPYYLSDVPSLPCPFLGLNYPLTQTVNLYIVMFEYPGKFTSTQYRLIRLLAQITAHYAQLSAHALSPDAPLLTLMLDILDNKLDDPTVIRDRISALPALHPHNHFYVLVFSVKEGEQDNAVLPYYMEDLSAMMAPLCSAIYQDRIVMLLSPASEKSAFPGDFPLQEDYLRRFYLSVGISARFSSLEELRTGYEQALSAIHFGRRFASERIVWHYSSYILYDLLSRVQQLTSQGILPVSSVKSLLEYDDSHGISLTRTLRTYLRTYSQTKTAELLGINRSTVIRHLALIREITGLSLESGDTCFLLRLTFAAMAFDDKNNDICH